MAKDEQLVVVKGAGDLATGVAYRLFKHGLAVIMTEIARPLAVRRSVAFAEAVYEGAVQVAGITAKLAGTPEQAKAILAGRAIPVLVDPAAEVVKILQPEVVVDARMAKRNLGTNRAEAPLVIALGPGFTAGVDVHAVIETCRGHDLGRVILQGGAKPNTGVPAAIDGQTWQRLLRAPCAGEVSRSRAIGDRVQKGEVAAYVGEIPVYAEIAGMVRGMLKEGVWVRAGTKIGDVDPRTAVQCDTISDKALTVGAGVAEAVDQLLDRGRSCDRAHDWKVDKP